MAHINKSVKGAAAAVEQQGLLVAQEQGKSLARENNDSGLAGNAAATDEVAANQVLAYAGEGDAWSAGRVASSDGSVTTWRYTPAAASADSSDFPVQPRTVDMAGSIKVQSGSLNVMDGLTVASGAFAFQHPVSISAPAQAAALESMPAPALAALAVPAPDLAAVAIPAPPYGDEGAMFRSSHTPPLDLTLARPLQTGMYVAVTITNSDDGMSVSYNSKTSPANFVFMGQIFMGNFSFTPPGGLSDGTYNMVASIFSSNDIRQFYATVKLVVDTVKPTETAALAAISHDTGISPGDFITNDPNQILSGTLSAALATGNQSGVSHEALTIDLINQSSGQSIFGGPRAASDNGLSWSFAPGFKLYDGTYTVRLQVKDAAGNTSSLVSDPQTIVIDTVAPNGAQLNTAPGGHWFTLGASDSGASVKGLSTSGTHLTFSGRYIGSLADGTQSGVSAERIEVNVGDGTGWHTATVDPAANTWTLDYTGIVLPIGTYDVQVRIADAAGNATASMGSPVKIVDPGDPPPPMITAISPDTSAGAGNPAVGSASDFITSTAGSGGKLTISGSARAANPNNGDKVQVSFDGGQHWADAAWSGSGWSYTTTTASGDPAGYNGAGTYKAADVQVREVSIVGVAGTSTASPHDIVVDNTAPAQTASLTQITDSNGNNTVKDPVSGAYIMASEYGLVFKGTLNNALSAGGNGVSKETLWINLGDGHGWQQVTNIASDNSWAFTNPNRLPDNGNGATPYRFELQVVDEAGNLGDSSSGDLIVKIPNPIPEIKSISPDTGVNDGSNSDFITSTQLNGGSGALTVKGDLDMALKTGQTVEVSLDGATWVTATAATNGMSWSATLLSVNDGAYTIQARVKNAAGGTGAPVERSLAVDNTAPSETGALAAISHDTGISPGDFITNDPSQTLIGTLSAVLATGDQSGVSHEVLMIDLINQSSGRSVLGGPKVASDDGQTWSFAPGFTLYDGAYTVQLQVKDAAGNTSRLVSDSQTIVIDTVAPNGAQLNTVSGGNWFTLGTSDSGASVKGLSTSGTHLTFSGRYIGSLADGAQSGVSAERIEVNVGDGTGWHTATVDPAAKTWTLDYTGTELHEGEYDVQVRIADAAGNATWSMGSPVTIVPPNTITATITAIDPDSSAGDGNPAVGNASDFITSTNGSSGKLTISGSTSAVNPNNGDKVQVSFDGGQHWAEATWSGSAWSYTTTTASGDTSGYNGEGTYKAADVQVRVGAGTSAASPHDIVVDNTAPAQTLALTQITDSINGINAVKDLASGAYIIGSDDGLVFKGTLDNALSAGGNGVSKETLWIKLDDGHGWQQVTNIASDNSWAFANPNPLPVNSSGTSCLIKLQVADEAGNLGSISTFDVVPPSLPPLIQSISPDTWVEDGNYGSGSDFITSTKLNGANGTLTVTGVLSEALKTDDTVGVSLDGTKWVDVTINGTSWSASIPSVNDGAYTIEARVKNAAGITSPLAEHSLTVDNTAPTQHASLTDVSGDKVNPGYQDPNHWVIDYDGDYECTLSGTLDGPLAVGSGSVTAEQLQVGVRTVAINGDASNWTWQAVTDISNAGGGYTWSHTISLDMTQETPGYEVKLREVDLAGNVKEEGASYILDQFIDIVWGEPPFAQSELNSQSHTAASDPKGLFTDVAAGSTLALRLSDVLSESNGTVGANGKHMTILGDATSTVQLDGSATLAATNWAVTGQQTVGGVTFDVYHNTAMGASAAADLLIQQGVQVI